MKIKTTIKRIEILADHMETVDESEFNFSIWGSSNFKSGKTCGTAGCAIGHATTMPYFRKLGLALSRTDFGIRPMLINKFGMRKTTINQDIISIIQTIFGGNEDLIHKLFIPEEDEEGRLPATATPQEWAAHARKIVARLRKEHGIPEPKRQSQSSPLEQKSVRAGWRELLETPRNLASDRLGVTPSRHTQHGQSACSAKQS